MWHFKILSINFVSTATPALLHFLFLRHIFCTYLLSWKPWRALSSRQMARPILLPNVLPRRQIQLVKGDYIHLDLDLNRLRTPLNTLFQIITYGCYIFKRNPLFVSSGARREKAICNYIIYCKYYSLNHLKESGYIKNEKSKSHFSMLY